jgi:hypothetical protein
MQLPFTAEHHTQGNVVAVWVRHIAIRFWPSVLSVLPTETAFQADALVVALLVLTALWLLAPHRAVDVNPRRT